MLELLNQLDGFDSKGDVKVAWTNLLKKMLLIGKKDCESNQDIKRHI